jgi:hypothetical protein
LGAISFEKAFSIQLKTSSNQITPFFWVVPRQLTTGAFM